MANSDCIKVMARRTSNRFLGLVGTTMIQTKAYSQKVQRQIKKKYVGVYRRRRNVVEGIPLSVLFFWLMTLTITLAVLLSSVGSMHCFSIPVNK